MGKPVPVESLYLNRWSRSLHGCPGFQVLCHLMVSSVAVCLWHWRSVVQLARALFFFFNYYYYFFYWETQLFMFVEDALLRYIY